MKLVDMTCTHCGSVLKVDPTTKECTCEYCGSKLIIDDETVHVNYDNAEEYGYLFEKGRQRAQREAASIEGTSTPQYPNSQNPPKKKKYIWLWVLGWIYIFPVPLTVLMLRKKEMKPAIKYGVIVAGWLLYFSVVGNRS